MYHLIYMSINPPSQEKQTALGLGLFATGAQQILEISSVVIHFVLVSDLFFFMLGINTNVKMSIQICHLYNWKIVPVLVH